MPPVENHRERGLTPGTAHLRHTHRPGPSSGDWPDEDDQQHRLTARAVTGTPTSAISPPLAASGSLCCGILPGESGPSAPRGRRTGVRDHAGRVNVVGFPPAAEGGQPTTDAVTRKGGVDVVVVSPCAERALSHMGGDQGDRHSSVRVLCQNGGPAWELPPPGDGRVRGAIVQEGPRHGGSQTARASTQSMQRATSPPGVFVAVPGVPHGYAGGTPSPAPRRERGGRRLHQ